MESAYQKTILLVEDEAVIALSEAKLLEKRGYKVITALSGEEAVDLLSSARAVDLILMDIDLGKESIDGTETAEKILQKYDLPVVFLSNHTEPEIVEKTESITSYGYVVKNTGDTVLDASIKMAFKLHNAHQEVRKRREEREEAFHELKIREKRLRHINRVLMSIRNVNQIITKDHETRDLMDKTCQSLIETSGYFNAWIILLEKGRPAEPFFHAGFPEKSFAPVTEQLRKGNIPDYAQKALKKGEIIITENVKGESSSMTAGIEHAGIVFGWISVAVPDVYARDPEEYQLFKEIVDDLGYALHKIGIEEERERAFSDLRKREQFLNGVFDSIQDGLSVLNTDLTIRRTNKVMEQWFPDKLPFKGKKCYFCYQNSDQPCDPCPSLRCLKSGRTESNIIPGPRGPDNGWLEIFSYPVKDPDSGEITGIVEFIRDITTRKQAEENLKKSEQEKNAILDSLVEHVIYEDRNLKIIWPNKAAYESAGMSREEIIGRHCYELWPNRDTPCPDCPVIEAIRTGEPHELEKATPDGREWFVRGYPVRDIRGEIIGAVEVTLEITESKRAEENLNATLNSIGDAVIAADIEGKIVRMNPVAEKLTGWTLDAACGKSLTEIFRIINSKTRGKVKNPVDEVLRSGKIAGLANHTKLISREGAEYHIADSAAPIRDASGHISGVVLVFRDVSEEYQIRESLQENEDRLSKIIAAANDGTWDWDLDTNVVEFDRRYYEMADYEKDEFPHTFEEFSKRVHPDDMHIVMDHAERHLKGELDRFEVEFRFARKEGGWIWILGRGIIVERHSDGTPSRFLGTHTDISKRKAVEETLLIERRRLAAVLEGTNVGSWEWNVQSGQIVINERWAEIVGYTLDELSPISFETWSKLTHPEDLKLSNDLLQKHFDGETEYYFCELRMRHKSGGWIWVLDKGKVAEWTDDGKPLLMSGTHQDITENKKADEDLRKALKEKENLLSELQHRIKNNLTMINSMISLKAGSVSSESTKDALDAIAARIRALSELYSLLYQSNSLEEIRLDVYCVNVISSMKTLTGKVRIKQAVDDFSVPVRIAATLGLIVTELVTNALKHAYSEDREGIITVSVSGNDNCVKVVVENDGRGLPEDFVLAESKGMGLKLVEAMVEQYKGSLSLESGDTTRVTAELHII